MSPTPKILQPAMQLYELVLYD